MIKITANSLRDYQTCARLYAYRYGEDKTTEKLDIRERRAARFDETIRRVITFFFYKKQAMAEPSYQALLNRWQKLWFEPGTNAMDIALAKNETWWNSDISYVTQATNALLVFYDEFANKPEQQVVLVDESFCVPLSKTVALEGQFDVILREQKPDKTFQYHIYKWANISIKRAISFWTFDFTIMDYAFRYRNSFKNLDTKFYLWNFNGSLIGSKEIELETEDIQTMRYWATELENTKVFASRRGFTSYCKSCPFDKKCAEWKLPVKVG